jgi:hypothetical protein
MAVVAHFEEGFQACVEFPFCLIGVPAAHGLQPALVV